MSIFRKDNEGNVTKIGGYLEKRFNPRYFVCPRSEVDGKEVYTVPEEATDYYKKLTAFTVYYLEFKEPNTTTTPYLKFGDQEFLIDDMTVDPEGVEVGTLYGVLQMFTQGDEKIYFMSPIMPGNGIYAVSAKKLAAGSDPTVENLGTPQKANFEFGIPTGDTGATGLEALECAAHYTNEGAPEIDTEMLISPTLFNRTPVVGDLTSVVWQGPDTRSFIVSAEVTAVASNITLKVINLTETSGNPAAVDDELSDTSENTVQNKVITEALKKKVSKEGDKMTGPLEVPLLLGTGDTENQGVIPVRHFTRTELGTTTSTPLTDYLVAWTKKVCELYPNRQYCLFIGQADPTSEIGIQMTIYNTNVLDNGMPRYAFGIVTQWNTKPRTVVINEYVLSLTNIYVEGGINTNPFYFNIDGSDTEPKNVLVNSKGSQLPVLRFKYGDKDGGYTAVVSNGKAVLAAGESYKQLETNITNLSYPKIAYVIADSGVTIMTNLDGGWANRKEFTFATNGNLTVPGQIYEGSNRVYSPNNPPKLNLIYSRQAGTSWSSFVKVGDYVQGFCELQSYRPGPGSSSTFRYYGTTFRGIVTSISGESIYITGVLYRGERGTSPNTGLYNQTAFANTTSGDIVYTAAQMEAASGYQGVRNTNYYIEILRVQ